MGIFALIEIVSIGNRAHSEEERTSCFLPHGPHFAHPQFFVVEESSRHPDMVGAGVWIYCKKVLRDLNTWEQPGLAEPLGEASSANTFLGSDGQVPMTSGNPQTVEGWLQIPPESGLMKPRRGVWLGQGERRQKTGGGQYGAHGCQLVAFLI
jgi:hypothetical protein